MKIFTREGKENVSYDLCINSLNKIYTWNCTALVKKSESTHSYGRAYVQDREGLYVESYKC